MKIPTQPARNARPILGKLVLALACAGVLGLSAAPAFAQNHNGRDNHGNNGRHGNNGWHNGHDRNWRGHGYQPQPVYVPPPVYYPPQPSPGISLFLPLNIRIR